MREPSPDRRTSYIKEVAQPEKAGFAMRSLTRIAVVGAIAAAVATATTTAAVAEDATVYSAGLGAKVQWVAYGDDMYITDTEADGHSAVGTYQWGATQYFYWNRGGKGTT